MKEICTKIKIYFNQEKAGVLKALAVLIFITASYFAYLFFVGIPMTKAKNFFNLGYLNYQEREYQMAKNALTTSLEIFYTQEAYDLLQKID